MPAPSELQTFVAERRAAAGLGLTALADRAGISRQALSAIEAGRAVPSTAVALSLARELGCRVEDLFALPNPPVPGLVAPAPAGSRVVLGRVGDRWVSHRVTARSPVAADGIVGVGGGVEALDELSRLASTVLLAGCAPALGTLAGRLERDRRVGARWVPTTSGEALRALAEGRTHFAGLHYASLDDPDTHDRIVREHLPGLELDIVSFVGWRGGLALAPGNPLGIRSLADLSRPGLRVGRRPPDAAASRMLVAALAGSGVAPEALRGPLVASHEDAAAAVLHGAADAAVLVEPVAEAYGLAFLPLSEERFELVLPSSERGHPGVQRVLERLSEARFAREVRSLGAYDTASMAAVRRVT